MPLSNAKFLTRSRVLDNSSAAVFDGVNDFIECGLINFDHLCCDDIGVNCGNAITMWFRVDAGDGIRTLIDGRSEDNVGVRLYINADERIIFQFNTVDVDICNDNYGNPITLDTDTWYHIAFKHGHGTSNIKMWLNGQTKWTAHADSPDSNNPGYGQDNFEMDIPAGTGFTVGATNYGTKTDFFKGEMSELAIYREAQLNNIGSYTYNDGEPFNHLLGGWAYKLYLWWRMGDEIEDIMTPGTMNDASQGLGMSSVANYGAELYTTANAASTTNEANATTGWVNLRGETIGSSDTAGRVADGTYAISRFWTHTSGSDSLYTSWSAVVGKIYKIQFTITYSLIHESYGAALVNSAIQVASGAPDDTAAADGGITGVVYNQDVWTDFTGIMSSISASDGGTDVDIRLFVEANATTMYLIWHWYGTVGFGQAIFLDGLSIKEVTGNSGTMYNFPNNPFVRNPPGSPQ